MRPIATDVWRGRSVCPSRNVSCKNGWTDRDAVWLVGPSNHVLDGGLDPPGEGAILGWGRGRARVKYSEHEVSATEIWLTRSRLHSAYGLVGGQGTVY